MAIVSAGPVTVDSVISCTGLYFVSVKYWVRPGHAGEDQPTVHRRGGPPVVEVDLDIANTTAAETAAERKNPRSTSSSRARSRSGATTGS